MLRYDPKLAYEWHSFSDLGAKKQMSRFIKSPFYFDKVNDHISIVLSYVLKPQAGPQDGSLLWSTA